MFQFVFNDKYGTGRTVSKRGAVQFKIPAFAGFFIIWRAYFMTSENTEQAPQSVKKRIPPKAGQGRVKGVPNKMTRILKEAVIKAAENAGNKIGNDGLTSYLEKQAMDCPAAYLALLGKVLPLQVTGEDGGAIKVITRVEIAPLVNDNHTD